MMKTQMTSVALFAMALAAPAVASSDGVPGPTSSGTFTVTATVTEEATDDVHVYGLGDLSLFFAPGAIAGTAGTFDGEPFCITRSPSGGDVNLTISSFDAADTEFVVKTPGGANQAYFYIRIDNTSNGGEFFDPIDGTQFSAVPVSASCSDVLGEPGTLRMEAVLSGTATVPGVYSGSFLLTVAPN